MTIFNDLSLKIQLISSISIFMSNLYFIHSWIGHDQFYNLSTWHITEGTKHRISAQTAKLPCAMLV